MTEMFRTCWFALQEISLGDKIALLVVCLTALSAEFARQAAIHAREANDIAAQSTMPSVPMRVRHFSPNSLV